MRIWAILALYFDPFGHFHLYSRKNNLDNLLCIFYNVSCLYFSATYCSCYMMRFTALKRSFRSAQFAREFCCYYVILLSLHLGFQQGSDVLLLVTSASLSGILWAFVIVSLYNFVLFMAPLICSFFILFTVIMRLFEET